MKKILATALLLGLLGFLPSFKNHPDEPQKAKPGTYQFIIKDTKREFAYTDEMLIWIESKRMDHEQITLGLNPVIEVIIPSRDAITAPGFKPMAEFFYVN